MGKTKTAAAKSKKKRVEFVDDFSDDDDDIEPATKSSKDKGKKKTQTEEEDYFGLEDDHAVGHSNWLEDESDDEDIATANDDDEEDDDALESEPPRRGKKGKNSKTSPSDAFRRHVVNMEHRTLTKKDVQSLKKWKGKARAKTLDNFLKGVVERCRKRFGHGSAFVGAETDTLIVGIPMYGGNDEEAYRFPGCLPMEYVFAQDVFPLGLIIQMVAKTGVGKSALLAEFGRWFDLAGGGLSLNENETKFNPKWYRSIMSDAVFNRMPYMRCNSVEDWMRKLSFAIRDMASFMDQKGSKDQEPGPGRTFPMLFGVDSIMGKMSEDTQDKILGKRDKQGRRGTTGEGAADRGFPIEALKITRYMRTIPQELDNYPFSIVLVNHLRIAKNDDGYEERRKAGGDQVGFQESFELQLEKHGGHKKKIECMEWEGYPIRISCEKNSFGPGHRSIITRLIWWEEELEDGGWRQKTVWDWDWSTVWLLNNLMKGEKANPRLKQGLKDIDFHLDCPSTAEIENLGWSKDLGMTKKDAVPWSQLGAMIRQDSKLMNRLRKALRINSRPLMQGDYLEQLDELKEEMP